jgi:uncharacterized protein DUF6544
MIPIVAIALVVLVVVFGVLGRGPRSLRAAYNRDVAHALARHGSDTPITDAELAPLPEPVRAYLRASGVVGQPRVRNFRVRMHGRIRNGRDGRWMPFTAEQHNFVGDAARLFYMNASMFMIPAQGYHRYVGPSVSMTVKVAALVPVVDASGREMCQSETVTLFNDMCIMAPATLIDPAIVWEPIDAHTARATFTNAGQTIRAELAFNQADELIDFWSDDRYQIDGSRVSQLRWSTPISTYRSFGRVRLASQGEGRWHEAGGEYAYIQLTIDAVDYNLPQASGGD